VPGSSPVNPVSVTRSISFDVTRVYLLASTPSPSKRSSIAFGFRLPDSKYYKLDQSVAGPVGDAALESASRSPRINATFSYQVK
jgi:hypothetical protein